MILRGKQLNYQFFVNSHHSQRARSSAIFRMLITQLNKRYAMHRTRLAIVLIEYSRTISTHCERTWLWIKFTQYFSSTVLEMIIDLHLTDIFPDVFNQFAYAYAHKVWLTPLFLLSKADETDLLFTVNCFNGNWTICTETTSVLWSLEVLSLDLFTMIPAFSRLKFNHQLQKKTTETIN